MQKWSLTLSHRLCKLFACHVRSLFRRIIVRVLLLTASTFRLNSREYARDRSTTDNPDSNSFKLSSIRLDPSSQAYGSKPAVSVTVHRSTASEFGRSKPDPDLDPAFDIAKPVRFLHLLATPRFDTYLICVSGCKHHPLSKPRSTIGSERLGSWHEHSAKRPRILRITFIGAVSEHTAPYPCTS